MDDADEALIPVLDPSRRSRDLNDGDASDSEGDSDAAPDYRFFTTATKKHALPSRGTKDFEPVPTSRQVSSLEASRKAMHDALSVIRVHNTRKNEMVGVYFSDTAQWDGVQFETIALMQVEDVEKREKMRQSTVLKAGEGRCVAVEKFTTTFARTMGQNDRRNWTWLLPEEALFLLERGSLDIRYVADEGADLDVEGDMAAESLDRNAVEDINNPTDSGPADTDCSNAPPRLRIGKIPMSLQGAYAAFIGKTGLTLERYLVYSNLRRAGYIVQRAPTWDGPVEKGSPSLQECAADVALAAKQSRADRSLPSPPASASLVNRLVRWLFPPTQKPSTMPCYNLVTGPLISPGLFRSYWDIFRQLYLIPQHQYSDSLSPPQTCQNDPLPQLTNDQGSVPARSTNADQPLLPTFIVHKPSALQGYKKSSPPPPHYTVVVLDARHSAVPTSSQIGDLLSSMPDDPLPDGKRKRIETRIKHGTKSVMIAVVDSGIVSYMRFSGGGFGPENILWEENERRGQRGGSKRGGWRGRGRGGNGGGRGGSG